MSDKIVSEQDKSIPPEKEKEQNTQQDETEEYSEYVIIAKVWWTVRVNPWGMGSKGQNSTFSEHLDYDNCHNLFDV